MRYRERPPHPRLAPLVRCFWSLEGAKAPAGIDRVLPDGHAELIVHCGDLFQRHHLSGDVELQPRAFLMGEIDRPFLLQPTGRASVFGVRLCPGAATALVPGPVAEWVGRTTTLDELWGTHGRELAESLAAVDGFDDRIRLAEGWLLHVAEGGRPLDSRVQAALAALARGVDLRRATRASEVGSRHLERLFHSHVGRSPKSMQRLLRFQSAARLLLKGERPAPGLAAVALGCGYSDQAHLTREFREFAAITPAAFVSSESELAELFHDPWFGGTRARLSAPEVGFLQDGPCG